MIKIKLLSRMAGPDGNHAEGSILDVEIKQALELVNGNYAELLEPLPIEEPQNDALKEQEEEPKPIKKAVTKK
jgi:hypothetical protein